MIRRIAPLAPLVLFAAACGGGPSNEELADELWAAVDGYESWSQVSPWDGVQPSESVHGDYVQIWFNGTATADFGGTIGDGGISVKKAYGAADGSDPVGVITVMYKVDGYDPDNGDWFYARYTDDGVAEVTGGAETPCAACHVGAAADDYLFTVNTAPVSEE